MKFKFIKNNRHEFPIIRMCYVLGVTRRGYRAWLGRPKSQRAEATKRSVKFTKRAGAPTEVHGFISPSINRANRAA